MSGRVGWYCVYTPEEIIVAAGWEPYRLVPSGETEGATALLPSTICPLVRSLASGLVRGTFPTLRGLVIVNSCHAMLHLYNALCDRFTEELFICLLDMPRRDDAAAAAHLAGELRTLAAFLGTKSGRAVTAERLWEAIRRQSETLDPREDFTVLDAPETARTARPRLALAGSFPPPGLADLIEEAGGVVAVDELCAGRRYRTGRAALLNEIAAMEGTGEDPFILLARGYLRRCPPCPRLLTRGEERRRGLLRLVEEHRVQGVVYHTLKFCDLGHYDYLWVRKTLRERGVPVLHLETELGTSDLGRLHTRVQAFLEML